MLVIYSKTIAYLCAALPLMIILCTFYAYRVNEKKAPGDPEKRDFSPNAIWLAPFTLPVLIAFNVISLILSSLMFGIFLILFPFALLLFRKPFLIQWISKQALKVGNLLLKINTKLLRPFGVSPTYILKHQYEG